MKPYRELLEDYWNQYTPGWKIPKGFHVHHIRPRATFADRNDPQIDDPRNLIALHPDDHVAIHANRGDVMPASSPLWSIAGYKHTEFTKQQISKSLKGRKKPPVTEEHRKNNAKAQKGKVLSAETRKKIGESRVGYVTSDATKRKQSVSNTGLKRTAATRKNIRNAKQGLRWFHNDNGDTRMCKMGEAPIGYRPGRGYFPIGEKK